MEKIDIMHQQSQQEQVLDIDQHQIIGLYEKLLNDDDFWKLFSVVLYDEGCVGGVKEIDGKRKFVACDPDVIKNRQAFPFPVNVHTEFEWVLILLCKKMLTYHHERKVVVVCEFGKAYSPDNEQVPIVLARKHLGILTKILKMENKRKAFLKKLRVRGDTN